MRTTSRNKTPPHVVVIGGGFTGLAAAYQLALDGVRVTVLEADTELGGLAAGFAVDRGQTLERFYHHWFTSDEHMMSLIRELDADDNLILRDTCTGLYYANRIFRLSTPLDLLRFSALAPVDRLRLGWLALRARAVRDWRQLEQLSASEWLLRLAGPDVYRVVWEPLLRGKFGDLAPDVSAVWIWNKLKLRGGSRGTKGHETLAYYRGGFPALIARLRTRIEQLGGLILTGTPAVGLEVNRGRIYGVKTAAGTLNADAVIATPALPIIADLIAPHVERDYLQRLKRIRYLANICLVLELDRSLSATYWLNVNDSSFPFVGIVEHTNFEPRSSYGGRHIVYLSRYLVESDPFYQLDSAQLLDHCLPYIQRMFPAFHRSWVKRHHLWRARYAQPIVGRDYSELMPGRDTPLAGFLIGTMAQIYPEDRGTNYAVRDGRELARYLTAWLRESAA